MNETMQTLEKFLYSENLQTLDNRNIELIELIKAVTSICIEISQLVRKGALENILGDANAQNIQGESQKNLDIITNQLLKDTLTKIPSVAAIASEEEDNIVAANNDGIFLAAFDPLDGSSNIDINGQIGTIFSIYPRLTHIPNDNEEQFLQPGIQQLCAGYVLYGASTLLALSTGRSTHLFTLDDTERRFILTTPIVKIPKDTQDFAINMSKRRFWPDSMRGYISGLELGVKGYRGKDFNMRWNGAMVGDVHRIMMKGGIFLYPSDTRDPQQPARLRLLYEVNPMAMLVENAGGKAWSETQRILLVQPQKIHERIAVYLGSANEVDTCLDSIS